MPRRSARSLARSGLVQNQPPGRRRRRPRSTSAARTSAVVGPKRSSSSSVSGSSAAAAHRCGPEHVRVGRVAHGRLDGRAEDRRRVMHEIRVERVVAGDQDRERVVAGPTCPSGLLPQGCAGAWPAAQQHGVEPGDVDAELERVGRGDPHQPPVAQLRLELAPLLGQVARPVRRHARGEVGLHLGERVARGHRDGLGATARADERQRAHALDHEIGEQHRGLGRRRTPGGRVVLAAVVGERRLPQRELRRAARRRVVGNRHHRQPGEPRRGPRGIACGGGREHERR